ncbi:hypothetical protein D3C71_1794180 [compost metagenome]
MTVQRHLNLHTAYQIALLKALGFTVFHVDDGLQATTVHFAVGPFVQRQGATQYVSIIHHRQESAAEVTQHTPVETVLRRWITG